MSWFKNITLLTLPATFSVDVSALESALAEHPLRSPGPLEDEKRGFVSPFARDDAAMTHGTDGATLFCLGEDSRLLPASVFNEALSPFASRPRMSVARSQTSSFALSQTPREVSALAARCSTPSAR